MEVKTRVAPVPEAEEGPQYPRTWISLASILPQGGYVKCHFGSQSENINPGENYFF